MPFFLIGALIYKQELVYVFIKLGCILACCVNTDSWLNVIMLEINRVISPAYGIIISVCVSVYEPNILILTQSVVT